MISTQHVVENGSSIQEMIEVISPIIIIIHAQRCKIFYLDIIKKTRQEAKCIHLNGGFHTFCLIRGSYPDKSLKRNRPKKEASFLWERSIIK